MQLSSPSPKRRTSSSRRNSNNDYNDHDRKNLIGNQHLLSSNELQSEIRKHEALNNQFVEEVSEKIAQSSKQEDLSDDHSSAILTEVSIFSEMNMSSIALKLDTSSVSLESISSSLSEQESVGKDPAVLTTVAGFPEFSTVPGSAEFTTVAGFPEFSTVPGSAEFTTVAGFPEFSTVAGFLEFSTVPGSAEFATSPDCPELTTWSGTAGEVTSNRPCRNVSSSVYDRSEQVFDETLRAVYHEMLSEDNEIYIEAINAYNEMNNNVRRSSHASDIECATKQQKRRSIVENLYCLNSLSSIKYSESNENSKISKKKIKKIKGKLVLTLTSTTAFLFVFLQSYFVSLCYNKVFTSSPHGGGILTSEVGSFYASFEDNGMLGPEISVLWELGGLNVDRIRNNGEVFRLFWSMWMHAGWIHIVFNVSSQIQYFCLFEPDWGFWRCLIIFWISGVTGNLISGSVNPCSTTVGSSGGLFGLMGAMIPYCIEYWHSIPKPCYILVISSVITIISLGTGFTQSTDNWAHIGGLIGGICSGFAMMKNASSCSNYCSSRFRNKKREKKYENFVAVIVNSDGVAKKKLIRGRKRKYDVCRCGPEECIIRTASISVLIILAAAGLGFIFSQYEYQPLGQVTFSGVIKCCCCYSPELQEYWRCLPCEIEVDYGMTWGNMCQTSISKKKSFNLKPEYQGRTLFETLGFGNIGLSTFLLNKEMRSMTANHTAVSHVSDYPNFWSSGSPTKQGVNGATASRALSASNVLLPSNNIDEYRSEEVFHLSNSDGLKSERNFSNYFIQPLTAEDANWLRYQENRWRQRTLLYKDILKRLMDEN